MRKDLSWNDAHRWHRQRGRRAIVAAVSAMVVGTLLSLGVAMAWRGSSHDAALLRFRSVADAQPAVLQATTDRYVRALEVTRGYLEADPGATARSFATFAESLHLVRDYPGLRSLEFVGKVRGGLSYPIVFVAPLSAAPGFLGSDLAASDVVVAQVLAGATRPGSVTVTPSTPDTWDRSQVVLDHARVRRRSPDRVGRRAHRSVRVRAGGLRLPPRGHPRRARMGRDPGGRRIGGTRRSGAARVRREHQCGDLRSDLDARGLGHGRVRGGGSGLPVDRLRDRARPGPAGIHRAVLLRPLPHARADPGRAACSRPRRVGGPRPRGDGGGRRGDRHDGRRRHDRVGQPRGRGAVRVDGRRAGGPAGGPGAPRPGRAHVRGRRGSRRLRTDAERPSSRRDGAARGRHAGADHGGGPHRVHPDRARCHPAQAPRAIS